MRHQDSVVHKDDPAPELQPVVFSAQYVSALRGEQVLVRRAAPRAVQKQVRPHRDLVLLLAFRDPDVGHEVAGVGGGILRPGVLRL